jgi:hypothetical protein
MGKEQQLPKHLKKSLDLNNFDVIRIISLGKLHPAVVMRDKRPDAKAYWCIQYRGSGYYFQRLKEVTHYLIIRSWIKAS